jgi:glycosyltransferase involved in cell wall biosynthesis
MWRNKSLSLILPTYNEKNSIKKCINDFNELGIFDEIIVVNNNAASGTSEEVNQTCAVEIFEKKQGYGYSIRKGLERTKSDLVVICEPDDTFLAKDVYKLLSYSQECDIVYGSRTIQTFIWDGANMGWFLRFGNWAVAKLMEVLFNTVSLSDVGCTFRLLNQRALYQLQDKYNVGGNFFGPEMMILSVLNKLKIVQIPINYKDRVGKSSVTGNFFKALVLGIQMIFLILKMRFLSWITLGRYRR